NDADEDPAWLEIEARPVGTAFTGIPTISSGPTSAGGTASASKPLAGDKYHWQYRVRDGYGGVTPWQSFGGNAETDVDFEIFFIGGSSGASSCLHSAGLAASATAWTSALAALLVLVVGGIGGSRKSSESHGPAVRRRPPGHHFCAR